MLLSFDQILKKCLVTSGIVYFVDGSSYVKLFLFVYDFGMLRTLD